MTVARAIAVAIGKAARVDDRGGDLTMLVCVTTYGYAMRMDQRGHRHILDRQWNELRRPVLCDLDAQRII